MLELVLSHLVLFIPPSIFRKVTFLLITLKDTRTEEACVSLDMGGDGPCF